MLMLACDVPGDGVTAVFLGALSAPSASDADRAALLAQRWGAFVHEAGLPSYLADALLPRRVRRGPR